MQTVPYHILLADDDEIDRQLFMEAFRELNIEAVIDTVTNGAELMEYLDKNERKTVPNFLFLDLYMPCKSGTQCLKEIRSNRKFDNMFIAIFSTAASNIDTEETFLNDANIFVIKPNEFGLLKQTLEKVINTAFKYQDLPFDKSKFLI